MLEQYPVSIIEIIRARSIVASRITATALTRYEALSQLTGCDLYVKHENHNPTGSFKIRGGVNLIHHLGQRGIDGVITFSTGNHGLSIATAAAWAGLDAVVVVPEGNNPAKNRLIRETGAELIEAGRSFEESATVVEKLCEERGLYYAHPANEPHLVNGVGTEFLEIAEMLPDVDAVIVPVGAGSEAAAAVTTFRAIRPEVEVYAVQAAASPAAVRSWRSGEVQSADNRTFAGGFATGVGYELPFSIYRDGLTDFVLLSEDELYRGIALAAFYTHNLVEGAGAATLMAALALREQLAGKKVVLQFSGCNASPEELSVAYGLAEFKQGYLK